MFTHKDVEFRSIFVINCLEHRTLRVSNGELMLEETSEEGVKTLTKLPFQKILMLFVIGNISITTPLIEKCKRFNVGLVVTNLSLRPVFFESNSAESNFLLRKKQHSLPKEDISIAKVLVRNKIENQLSLLQKTRLKDKQTLKAEKVCERVLSLIDKQKDYNRLMSVEGNVSKEFFGAYFQNLDWQKRQPRVKNDAINSTLDIGYTILFNYVECFVRMFGFDVYVGVYHRLWFRRKSLICDLVEPFRCIIDRAVRTAFNRKQFSDKDFSVVKGEWRLRYDKNKDYCKVFFDALLPYKMEIFKNVQSYYRCFMRGADTASYPKFLV